MNFNRSKWVYLVGFFIILALPLLNLPPWFSPPDWGKTIVFRIILSVLIFLFIWQILHKKEGVSAVSRNVLRGFAIKVLVALLAIYVLATLFSLDRGFSLWGSPYRSGGFINFAFYIIFAILAFLILRRSDWQTIWNFAIVIGILVSIIAIFQQFGLISKIFIPFEIRPPSTIGGPIFLAIYLLLLSFLTLAFLIKEKKLLKKIFYFSSLVLFIFTAVFITQTRAVILGLAIGFLYFLILYPFQKRWFSIGLKIITLIFLVLGIYGIYFINTQTELPQIIQENKLLRGVISRLSIKTALEDPRISGWKVSWQALKSKPIFGYGPENFAIGFDKYYDPSLPGLEKVPTATFYSWWDRAHNFIFDIGVTAGIPALIIYLLLFGVLFWQLQKIKHTEIHRNEHRNTQIIAHGIQATFLAYLAANFFSFDTFSTYLISFLLIGYSLCLIGENRSNNDATHKNTQKRTQKNTKGLWKSVFIFVLFCVLIWFIWAFNIKPFKINAQINKAEYLAEHNKCNKAFSIMESILPSFSFLDHYLNLEYAEIIGNCLKEMPEKKQELSQKAIQLLKENVKINPYYTRSWLLLGHYTNILIENGEKELQDEANYYFEKAYELSPKHQEIFLEWIKTDLITGEYQKAEERAQKCIDLNQELDECWWLMGLSQAHLGKFKEANRFIEIAEEKGYNATTETSLLQLSNAYIINKNYSGLVETYSQLVLLKPENPQYHAFLAVAYREVKEFEKAAQEALKVIELKPEAKQEVEAFLKTLK